MEATIPSDSNMAVAKNVITFSIFLGKRRNFIAIRASKVDSQRLHLGEHGCTLFSISIGLYSTAPPGVPRMNKRKPDSSACLCIWVPDAR